MNEVLGVQTPGTQLTSMTTEGCPTLGRRLLARLGLQVGGLMFLSACSVFHTSVTTDFRQAERARPYDALIVPGFPMKEGKWNLVVKARVYWAKHLYDQGVVKRIIFSGAAVHTPYEEGTLMALYAVAIGIPSEAILTETQAQHTCENLFFSYRLAQRLGLRKVAVASDPVQTTRLRAFASDFRLPVAFLPVDFVLLARIPKVNPRIDAEAAYVEDFVRLSDRYPRGEIKRRSSGEFIRMELSVGSYRENGNEGEEAVGTRGINRVRE